MTSPLVLKGPCTEPDCDVRAVARGLCPKHYHIAKKAGFPNHPKRPKLPTRFPSYCSQEPCDERVKGHGLCQTHYTRWVWRGRHPEHLTDESLLERRYSKPALGKTREQSPRWTGDTDSYHTAHRRVRAMFGSARGFLCVDCGAQAKEWSYEGGDPDERTAPRLDDPTKCIAFSNKPEFYKPRCKPCHVAYDRMR